MQPCPYQPACPGCPRFMQGGPSPSALGRLEQLSRRLDCTSLHFHTGAPLSFRVRARLAVRGTSRSPRVGIFREGTHEVVSIPECPIHHPVVNRCAEALREAVVETGAPVFDERSHGPGVRYLQVVVQRRSRSAQIVLVTNDAEPTTASALLEAFQKKAEPHVHSVFWNENQGRANAILGSRFVRICGPEAVHEYVAGASVYFPPGAFGQSNLDLAEQIVLRIHGWVPPGSRVAELYCGVGAIGLGLAPAVRELRMNEIGAASLRGLELGIAQLRADVADRVVVTPGSAGEAGSLVQDVDVVIVDPPRKGLDSDLLDALTRSRPPDVVYVSCGLASLERDAEVLAGAGYHAVEVHAYDLFPHTEHVETLVRLRR